MTEGYTSRLPGFYELGRQERLVALREASGISQSALEALAGPLGTEPSIADSMIENAVGAFALPLGIATNFIVNGRDVLVPMAIEEPSVVAGASNMAKLVREAGGFEAQAGPPHMIGQIQILEVPDPDGAERKLEAERARLLAEVRGLHPAIEELGGGPQDLQVRTLPDTPVGPMLVVHLIYDTRDAMGANAMNTAVERLAPRVEAITGGRAHLRILSNLADRRLGRARCRLPLSSLAFRTFSAQEVREGIVDAWAFAAADPYRAATHNKGIMNGVDAVLISTGNDWRAVEAGAHAYAARSGRYTSLTRWMVDDDGHLVGDLEMPLAVGTVGGATRVHPAAKASLELMRVESAQQLAEIIVSVGLAQNLAALRALATEGIQRGHMRLHARQVAIAAGAQGDQVEHVARRMVEEDAVRIERAQALLEEEN